MSASRPHPRPLTPARRPHWSARSRATQSPQLKHRPFARGHAQGDCIMARRLTITDCAEQDAASGATIDASGERNEPHQVRVDERQDERRALPSRLRNVSRRRTQRRPRRVAIHDSPSVDCRSGRSTRSRTVDGAVVVVPSARRGLLSVEEAAQYLGIASGTIRNWLSMRRIEHVKVGRLTRISQTVLDRYVAKHTVRAEAEE